MRFKQKIMRRLTLLSIVLIAFDATEIGCIQKWLNVIKFSRWFSLSLMYRGL